MAILNSGLAKSLAAGDYTIDNSLRFNDDGYLDRTPSASNRKTWTWSGWIKRGNLGAVGSRQHFFTAGDTADGYNSFYFEWHDPDTVLFGDYASDWVWQFFTTQLFRDPTAWYHFVLTVDTTQSTESDRVKFYVNGSQVTDFSTETYPSEDYEGYVNSAVVHTIGNMGGFSRPLEGYLAEVYFIDGTAYDADDFGELDSDTNQWKPKDASGLTFGTNGFYQKYGGIPLQVDAFTSAGSDTWTCPADVTSVEILTVAGGGGGGAGSGGGGAGGVVHNSSYTTVPGVVYDLTIGAGGNGAGQNGGSGSVGSDSVFNVNAEGSGATVTADGGAQGAFHGNGEDGGSGGGSGGWSSGAYVGGSATQGTSGGGTGYGNDGGGSDAVYSGGGGGGAAAVGATGTSGGGGAGGAGRLFSSFTAYGVSGYFAGGGGGGGDNGGGAGGSGGGGAGGSTPSAGSSATANTGSGGGGGGGGAEWRAGGDGGSGVILITYGTSLGNDYSGNDNDFAVTNLVATDQMIDTPTNNWCTFNTLAKMPATGAAAISEGNLKIISSSWGGFKSSFVVPKTGKFYCEVYVGGTTDGSNTNVSGLVPGIQDHYTDTGVYAWFSNDGTVRYSNSDLTTTTAPDTGDIMSWYVNDGEVKIYLNNVLKYTYSTNLSAVDDDYFFYTQSVGASHFATVNFGQDSSFAGVKTAQNNDDDGDATADWYYAPPTGVASLCADNLSDPEIALPGDYFNTLIWAGDGSGARSFTGVGFQPDFVWAKGRSLDYSHSLYDSIRGGGANAELVSNSDVGEGGSNNDQYGYLSSIDSDGFTTASGTSANNYFNHSSYTYLSWNWKAGGAPTADNSAGAGAVPTAGSVVIDGSNLGSALAGTIAAKKISANTTSGFSIVEYVGVASDTSTVAHGLSVAPDLVIVKRIDASAYWIVGSPELGTDTYPRNVYLNDTAAEQNDQMWGAQPSASVFSIRSSTSLNASSGEYIAYCFNSIEGYSKVGTYTGNANADGTFVYCGFRPAYVLVRAINATTNWNVANNKSPAFNVVNLYLTPNTSAAESAEAFADFTANGFKFRNTATSFNAAYDYMFYAIAESPFKTSNAR